MARTAPTVDSVTGPAYVHVAFRFIDISGDLRTVSFDVDPADATDAKIEAHAAALGAITNADLYAVEVTNVYGAVADSSNAATGEKSESVYDNIVVLLKNTINQSKRGFVPAPIGAVMTQGTDQIDGNDTDLATYLTSLQDLFAAGSYSITGARYTERREINEQVKF